jgi:hypothetical protein
MIQGLGNRKFLGVSVGDASLTVAQVHGSSAGARVGKTGVFSFGQGVSWEKPEEVGKAFGVYLREQGFSARQAVVGLPAHWTLLDARGVPEASEVVVQGVIRMLIEREYQPEGKEWVFDYVRNAGGEGRAEVALAATSEDRLAKVNKMAMAAGLKKPRVTSTLVAMMAHIAKETVGATLVLHVRGDGVECGVMTGAGVQASEWLGSDIGDTQGLGDEIRRLAASRLAAVGAGAIDVVAYCAAAGSEAAVRAALTRAGLTDGDAGKKAKLAIKGGSDAVYSASVALGESALAGAAAGLDFGKSRLLIDTGATARRRRMLAVLVAFVVLATVGYCAIDWYQQKAELAVKTDEITGMKELLVREQARIDKLQKARGWMDKRPSMLDQVRAFTMAMPSGGQVWATSISIRDDKTGTFIGKAQTEKGVIELLDRLRGTGRFVDVKLLYLRQADRTSKAVSFALTFGIKAQE